MHKFSCSPKCPHFCGTDGVLFITPKFMENKTEGRNGEDERNRNMAKKSYHKQSKMSLED